jgi:hypothetical protein
MQSRLAGFVLALVHVAEEVQGIATALAEDENIPPGKRRRITLGF